MMYLTKKLLLALILGVGMMMMALIGCNKDDAEGIVINDLLGKWQSHSFEVTACTEVRNDVARRDCDLTNIDDVDCAILEFRADGSIIADNQPMEAAGNYKIDNDILTLVDIENDTSIVRFEVSTTNLIFFVEEFNDPGCLLSVYFDRIQ